jgi:hypothetical protein
MPPNAPAGTPRPPPSLPSLLDLQPYAATRRTHFCKHCSTRFSSRVNRLRCRCVVGELPEGLAAAQNSNRAPGSPPALSVCNWQAPLVEALAAWWGALSSTDSANVLNMALDGAIGSQICSWWGITAFWSSSDWLQSIGRLSACPAVLAVAIHLQTDCRVIVAGVQSHPRHIHDKSGVPLACTDCGTAFVINATLLSLPFLMLGEAN